MESNGPVGTFSDKKSFIFSKAIGEGGGGKVYLTYNIHTKQRFAIKTEKIRKRCAHNFQHEIDILRSIKHDNIISLWGSFENEGKSYMVLDYMDGGDLLDDLIDKKCYPEQRARQVTGSILEAVRHIHRCGIVHRDLKPENVLLDSCGGVKIADFDLAVQISSTESDDEEDRSLPQHQNFLRTRCGTSGYMAPEILRREPYGKAVDIWSVGVILFIMLGGYHPFGNLKEGKTDELVLRGLYEFYEPYWCHVSAEAKIFITELFALQPSGRPTASESLQSSWLQRERSFSKYNPLQCFKIFEGLQGVQ